MRVDELSMQQKENPSTVNQLLSQIPGTSGQGEFLELILRLRAALEHPTFLGNPREFRVPKGMISRDSCQPHNTRISMGTSGSVFF